MASAALAANSLAIVCSTAIEGLLEPNPVVADIPIQAIAPSLGAPSETIPPVLKSSNRSAHLIGMAWLTHCRVVDVLG